MHAVIVAYQEGWQEALPCYGQRQIYFQTSFVEEKSMESTLSCEMLSLLQLPHSARIASF